MPPKKAAPKPNSAARIALPYRILFLYVEPLGALAGAVLAHFFPFFYLAMTHSSSVPPPAMVPRMLGTTAVLSQLANLYLLFALNEAIILRVALRSGNGGLAVWRALLFGLAVADIGHLLSVARTGTFYEIYIAFWQWNALSWGSQGFVYLGFCFRVAFLLGIGVKRS